MPKATSLANYMAYNIGRGEVGVLTFEPYKSILLPHWRYKDVPSAQKSSQTLYQKFLEFDEEDDFVGMDMCRKFIQMGMTRSKRYANYKGGKKYVGKVEEGNEGKGYGIRGREKLEKSEGHEGKEEKEAVSEIFKEVLGKCRSHEGYLKKKERFQDEKKEWKKTEATERKNEDT